MMNRFLTAGVCSTLLVSAPLVVSAQEGNNQNPFLQPDDSWISLSGTVTSTTENSFVLDYGDGLITVEVDEWGWDEKNLENLSGDKVTVYGEVDDDVYEKDKIEASSVYVEDRGTYFYASPADEEGTMDPDFRPDPEIGVGDFTITGTVTSVSGLEFTIDTEDQKMTVDTSTMDYNPMDDEGFQQIDKGDTVTVTGNVDADTFEDMELLAETIVTLEEG